MWPKDDEQYDGEKLFGGEPDPEKKWYEPEIIQMGRGTVLQWMQSCVDAGVIKLEETALTFGSDHTPVWIATDFLYESYRASCSDLSIWYPVHKHFFGRILSKMLGPAVRLWTTAVPEDRAQVMFGQRKRPIRPWGHFVPSSETWQKLLDARLRISPQIRPPRPARPANEAGLAD
jgi:hypothetical protein